MMRFTLEIEDPDKAHRAQVARAVAQGAILQNMRLFRARRAPRLYDSRVRYFSPRADDSGAQRILTIPSVLREGGGTCIDLCAWRAAELRVLGDARIGVLACKWGPNLRCHHGLFRNEAGQILPACPDLKLYWRGPGSQVLHCEVRLPSGDAEDPSRFLGMRGGRRSGG